VRVFHIESFFPLVDIQHTQCPCQFLLGGSPSRGNGNRPRGEKVERGGKGPRQEFRPEGAGAEERTTNSPRSGVAPLSAMLPPVMICPQNTAAAVVHTATTA